MYVFDDGADVRVFEVVGRVVRLWTVVDRRITKSFADVKERSFDGLRVEGKRAM